MNVFSPLDGETKIDDYGRFKMAFDDLEIALPWGLHSRGSDCAEKEGWKKSTKDLICQNHLHANHHSRSSSTSQETIKSD